MGSKLVFPDETITLLQKEIVQAEDQEVMFVASVSEKFELKNARAVARGNNVSVPALLPHAEKGDVIIHNHPSGVLKPSQADLAVASFLGNQGIGFIIVNNDVSDFYVVAEPVERTDTSYLNPDLLEQYFAPDGSLSQFIDLYESRDSQIEMLKAVADAFNNNKLAAIEAGTGVGKSLAYLVPAINWASDNDERVVISTATINLQHQLLEKDIPLAENVLGRKVKTVLVKGRGNYVCLRRLYEEIEEPALFDDEKASLGTILRWAESSATGNRTELSFMPEQSVWQRVNSETDTCTGLLCKHREKCFVLKARKEAAQAQILIVNHHLLFADISLRLAGVGYDSAAVLPPFQRLIFDEAHAIEKSATSFFSSSFTRNSLFRQLSRLLSSGRGSNRGLLVNLQKVYHDSHIFAELPDMVREVKNKVDALNEYTLYLISDQGNLRITKENIKEVEAELFPQLVNLQDELNKLLNNLQTLLNLCKEILDPEDEHLFELKSTINRLDEINSIAKSFLQKAPDDENVYWIDKKQGNRGDRWAIFNITPVDISAIMREAVFSQYETVVCTSATLKVNKSFDFWQSRVGLNDINGRDIIGESFDSPFPYHTNTMLCIPNDIPEPNSSEYSIQIKQNLAALLELTEGRALILFTSYRMLQDFFYEIQPRLHALGILVMKQGDDERSRLLDRFNKDTKSVLFATDSFWEGVDSPGETLQVVVICKLPFRVPSDPIVKARMEAVEKRGGNSFKELSIPEAVMKFKQGFGRLMRKKTDRGIVVIYDNRIINKYYGKYFLNSLPKTLTSIKENKHMLTDIENFLYQ